MKINYEQECNYMKSLKSSMPLLPDPQSLVDEKKKHVHQLKWSIRVVKWKSTATTFDK